MRKFVESDPRRKICEFLAPGDSRGPRGFLQAKRLARKSRIVEPNDSNFFGVFRPTSTEAIYAMMTGRARGKALNIKGKSAKSGQLSGFVPFLQISEEEDKKRVSPGERDSRVRVFYASRTARAQALSYLRPILLEMVTASIAAHQKLSAFESGAMELSGSEREAACEAERWQMDPPHANGEDEDDESDDDEEEQGRGEERKAARLIELIECEDALGLEMPERLLWEAYVMRQDISHEAGGFGPTGRASEPAFMSLNLFSLADDSLPKCVLWQHDLSNPLNPRGLLMAHEEDRVRPVASDFDCFTLGSRGLKFEPLPAEQVELVRTMLDGVESILAEPKPVAWTGRWLNMLMTTGSMHRHDHEIPEYGFGDPTSYEIMKTVAKKLYGTGAVRHGAECFNFLFPQELDDQFLVCWDGFLGPPVYSKVPWQYVDVTGLRTFLAARISEGYACPINPKWALCDEGWYSLLKQLLASEAARGACDAWYPPKSGLRERMEAIHQAYPNGFQPDTSQGALIADVSADEAQWMLRRHQLLARAKKKLRALAVMTQVMRSKKSRRTLRKVLRVGTQVTAMKRSMTQAIPRTDSALATEPRTLDISDGGGDR